MTIRQALVCGVAGVLGLVGCEGMQSAAQSKTVQGAAIGGLLGAGTGAIVGNAVGATGAGTAIGAGMGALAGGEVGSNMEVQDRTIEELELRQSDHAAVRGQKVCPVGGEFYGAQMKFCPIHGAELREELRD